MKKRFGLGLVLSTMLLAAAMPAGAQESAAATPTATTAATPAAPAGMPITLKAELKKGYIVVLAWSEYIPGGKLAYNVYRADHFHLSFHKVNSTPIQDETKMVGIGVNGDWYFKVKPILQAEPLVEGPESNEVKVTVTEAPKANLLRPKITSFTTDQNITYVKNKESNVFRAQVTPGGTPYPTPCITRGASAYIIGIGSHDKAQVVVRIFDAHQELVRELSNSVLPDDQKTLEWDGKDAERLWAPPGNYWLEITQKLQGKSSTTYESFSVTEDHPK